MKHLLFATLIILLSGCGFLSSIKRPEPVQVVPEEPRIDAVARAVNSTIALRDMQGEIFCSGVATEGTFLTAFHCVDGETQFQVSYLGRLYPGAVIVTLPEYDLAVIDAVGASLRDMVPMSDWEPAWGMKVVYLGHPLGLPLLMFNGIVASPVGVGFFQVDGQFIPGNSGGPVLDERGRLLGIVSATMALPGNPLPQFLPIGYAVRPAHLRQILSLT